ncbi:phosphotransferase family protein [Spongiibacter sp.]|uniref:phosphotransferase family protein n=1 Tax=Spongiibacter sp. TaxID=2024860 RepID=UPI003562CAEF
MSANQLAEMLASCLAERFGQAAEIVQLKPLTGGAASQTWALEARCGGQQRSLILRAGDDEEQFENALLKPIEAELIAMLHRSGLPVPEVIARTPAVAEVGAGFLMSRLPGEALPKRILNEPRLAQARQGLAAQCGQVLAALHGIPVDSATMLSGFDVEQDVLRYRARYREFRQCLPVFDLAFYYLLEQLPRVREPAIVHGDFRNGNLLVDEGGLSGVLDWELAHIGNPVEDLGWLCVNSWRFGNVDKPVGGFGDKETLLAAYNNAGGLDVQMDELNYWEIFGVLKWGVLCLYQSAIHLDGKQRSLERAVIGRRLSECEADLAQLLIGQKPCR